MAEIAADFTGSFGVLQRGEQYLMVKNRRRVHGAWTETWDLPGGEVEPPELLHEALARELREEIQVEVAGTPRFLFFQEGLRLQGDARRSTWRSFFFAVARWDGEPRPGAEILDVAWMDEAQLRRELHAPYHDSFLQWLADGGRHFRSDWREG